MIVNCGNNLLKYDCGSCTGGVSGEEYCRGECHWLKEANYCVHTAGTTFIYVIIKTSHTNIEHSYSSHGSSIPVSVFLWYCW